MPIGKARGFRYIHNMNIRSKLIRKTTARFIFIIGLFLMILGTTFLFGPMEGRSRLSLFIAFLLVVMGVFCAVFAIKLNKQTAYLFLATFFFLSGIFLLLLALDIIPLSLTEAWPLLSVISGASLLPLALRRRGGFKPSYFVSSCVFIILGLVMLFFSLNIVPITFRQFIQEWWPVLVILSGLILVLISLSVRKKINPGEEVKSGEKTSGEKTSGERT